MYHVHVGQTVYMYLVYIYVMYHVHVGQTMYMYLVYTWIHVMYHVHVGQTDKPLVCRSSKCCCKDISLLIYNYLYIYTCTS